jgi:cold shock CspA family protein
VTELERSGRGGHRGVVTAFDADTGLGVVTGPTGAEYPFHCIEIADGSRTIEVGTEITFRLIPKLGRWEAAALAP